MPNFGRVVPIADKDAYKSIRIGGSGIARVFLSRDEPNLYGQLFVRRDDDAVVFLSNEVVKALEESTKHVNKLEDV